MRSPVREIERNLRDGTTVRIDVYGKYVPAEPNFPSDIIGFDFRVYGERGELSQRDLPIEWERLESAAMDSLVEPLEESHRETA